MTKLSVIIPTLGRASLARTLASCTDADEIILVLDKARGGHLSCEIGPNVVFTEGHFGVTGGHAGRVHGIGLATGTHLAFMDDDDIYVEGAIDLMRDAACERPVIFRMDHYSHGVLWDAPELRFGNVSTQMYVVPNEPEKLGSWSEHVPGLKEPGGDFTFIAETAEKLGAPVWREEIIAVLRPDVRRGPSIAIVTPWQDHLELADDYFEAVLPELQVGDENFIVDNGSEPPLAFGTYRPFANLGFAGGSNIGLDMTSREAVLFLNNDIRRLRYGWLNEIRRELEPGVLVGNLRFDHHAAVDSQPFPYLDGWCLAGMREDLLALGGFDTRLSEPAYYSDNLLCLEARAAGMTLRDLRVGLEHKLNATAGPGSDARVRAATKANRSRYETRVRELLAVA